MQGECQGPLLDASTTHNCDKLQAPCVVGSTRGRFHFANCSCTHLHALLGVLHVAVVKLEVVHAPLRIRGRVLSSAAAARDSEVGRKAGKEAGWVPGAG